LVIGRRQDPGKLVVEDNGTDVVQVTIQSKEASPALVGPDLDLVIITSRNEKRLGVMEIDGSNRAIVLFKAVN
jgi:hypothetical protein